MDYERGLTELKHRLQANNPDRLVEFTTLEARLRDNLSAEQRFGTDEVIRSERARVVGELNRLAFESVRTSFNDLCQTSPSRFPGIPLPPQPYFAHPYPLQANFTGRLVERQILTNWLTNDERPILTLIAMGGMGKSSLSWYWLNHDVDQQKLDGILWWSFYEGEASFTKFLDEALFYVSNQTIDPAKMSTSYEKAHVLLTLLQQKRVLFFLDGFERQLWAYASLDATYQSDIGTSKIIDARLCVDLSVARFLRNLAAGPTRAKVLITTRLMIRELEDRTKQPLAGCRKEELMSLHPDDATKFIRAYIGKGTDTEIKAVCQEYGYHPLSIRLLSGLVLRDKHKPGDIAAAPRYDVHAELIARQHHVLEAAYQALPDELQVVVTDSGISKHNQL